MMGRAYGLTEGVYLVRAVVIVDIIAPSLGLCAQ